MPALCKLTRLQRLGGSIQRSSDVEQLVRALPRLTHLILSGGCQLDLANQDAFITLKSKNLVSVDIRQAGKGIGFQRIACLALREMLCSEYALF